VSRPPLERGTVRIHDDRIVAVEAHNARRADVDLGDAAIVPGFVNAHTHLDLSGLRGRVPFTGEFTDWLREVIRHRRGLTDEDVSNAVQAGLAESLAHGVTLLGDISGAGLSWPILADAPLRAVVFHEMVGLPKERASQAWTAATDWLRQHVSTPTCRAALSPHAPYSVRAALFRMTAALAAQDGRPVMTHLAETRAELELLAHHGGPFVPFLQGVGVWDPDGLVKSAEQVCELTRRAPHVLYAHGNYLDPQTPLGPKATIVYCPRTHAFFRHEPHPFREFLRREVRVALGTDSLASNPDLDLFAEARVVRRAQPDVSGDTLLRMATLSGAEALGWADETGSLDAGKSADLVALSVGPKTAADPHDLLFAESTTVQRVLYRGTWSGPPVA
jgi:cytosine/adenosine deaminase-related metal-dependent hydrolase